MLLTWSWIQHLIAGAIMFHLFMVMDIESPSLLDYLYGLFLFVHIFSFTAMLDHKKYVILAEFSKMVLGYVLIYVQGNVWYDIKGIFTLFIMFYFVLSFILTLNFYLKHKPVSA